MSTSYFPQHILWYILILSCFSCSYLPETLDEEPNLVIQENAEYILLSSATIDNNKAGIIFYPGGLVDPHAYINQLQDFALEEQRAVIILKVSSNLAILNTQKASSIIQEFPNIRRWIVGGHSLGGSTACIDISKNPDSFAGLFLLAAYSVDDLTAINIPMISILGSRDGVLDIGKYDSNRDNLPVNVFVDFPSDLPTQGTIGSTICYEIEGGNHAQFGNYGTQEGDRDASISSEDQQSLTLDMLKAFFAVNLL